MIKKKFVKLKRVFACGTVALGIGILSAVTFDPVEDQTANNPIFTFHLNTNAKRTETTLDFTYSSKNLENNLFAYSHVAQSDPGWTSESNNRLYIDNYLKALKNSDNSGPASFYVYITPSGGDISSAKAEKLGTFLLFPGQNHGDQHISFRLNGKPGSFDLHIGLDNSPKTVLCPYEDADPNHSTSTDWLANNLRDNFKEYSGNVYAPRLEDNRVFRYEISFDSSTFSDTEMKSAGGIGVDTVIGIKWVGNTSTNIVNYIVGIVSVIGIVALLAPTLYFIIRRN